VKQSAEHGRTWARPEKLASEESGNGFSFVVCPGKTGDNIGGEKKKTLEYDIKR